MKVLKHTLVPFLILLFIATSCNKDKGNDNDQNDNYVNMEDLIVSPDFDWSTTQDVSIKIYAKDNQDDPIPGVPVEVYTDYPSEGGLLMIKGITDDNGYFEAERPVSSHLNDLVIGTKFIGLVDFIKAPIQGGEAEATFGGKYVRKKSVEWLPPKSTNSIIHFLGGYDSDGVPDYLESPDDVISAEFLDDITHTLPEKQHVNVEHPEYLVPDNQHDLILECDATVWVTFVHEAAAYKNVLGFYSYDLGDPPTSVDDIDTITVIFPNTSYQGSGGGLHAGNKVEIGSFEENTGIGWVLIADGWDGSQVTDGRNYYYSEMDFNPESDADLRQHLVMINDPARDRVLLGWEDIQRDNQGNDNSKCDHDFNDCVYYFTIDPLPCAVLDIPVISYTATDSDGDGVPDHFDDYPSDASFAFNNYYPCGVANGTLAFEDLWPGKGDYDFNDFVANYHYNQITNGENKIVKIKGRFIILAHGASYHNGFGLGFNLEPNDITSITGQELLEGYITTNANGTEADQTNAVVVILDDAYNHLPHPGIGIGVNTEEAAPYVEPDTINIEIELNGAFTSTEVGRPPFNPFIISDGRRGYEVHLPDHAPTDLHNESLFGTMEDDSNPTAGRYYKTGNHLPWGIDIWADFDYPIEKVQITATHLKFADWAESDGNLFTDWYEDNPGYRNDDNIYHPPTK